MKSIRFSLAFAACFTWILPSAVLQADDPRGNRQPQVASLASQVRDVALGSNGQLSGQLLDMNGKPQAQHQIIVVRNNTLLHRSTSDANGRFKFDGLNGGVVQIVTPDSMTVCRCWTPDTAPPSAKTELLVVGDDPVLRGQRPFGEWLFSPPVLIGLVIAAAIAIPIAIHNSQDNGS